MKIEGKKVYMIPFEESHLKDPKYLKWMNDYEVTKGIYRPEYDEGVEFSELESYFKEMKTKKDALFFAMFDKEDDAFIGTCKIQAIDERAKDAELGILIGDRTRWGKGLATDVFATLAKHCFESLNLRKVWGGTMGNNIGMVKVFEKLGFKQEGCFRDKLFFEGNFVDRVYFGCFKDEFNEKYW